MGAAARAMRCNESMLRMKAIAEVLLLSLSMLAASAACIPEEPPTSPKTPTTEPVKGPPTRNVPVVLRGEPAMCINQDCEARTNALR